MHTFNDFSEERRCLTTWKADVTRNAKSAFRHEGND